MDALVVGAGPTGLTTVAELARYGLRCRVVEQLEKSSLLSRALAVQARTLEVGYVGHRERPIEPKRLEAELSRRLGPPGASDEKRVVG
ncbi:NAD(P)-binding protein [Archangium minus]|uniref:NAD(P)-binding protein n=1 Tax=Archangium minus TaxID=83450 RepID=A0ABY9XC25_9BACT|nr:NAD(P)-binding protein [Archangium minus]